jgi:type II secretory pathway component GspD/PulD (secretin)
MATVVSNVILASIRGGAAGGASGGIPFEQRAMMSARMGSSAATSGQVVAHAETNSLIVTASEATLDLVEQVIKELDKVQPINSTTFVRSLGSASATEVAQLLVSMYGRRSGTGSASGTNAFGMNARGNTNQQRQRLNSTGNRNRNSSFGNNFGSSFGGSFGGQRSGRVTFPQ